VLSSFIPDDERIVTIEDSAELNLAQRHVVRWRPARRCPAPMKAMVIDDRVWSRARCDASRPIVVGECRSGEALDMLQAMNTGTTDSLTTRMPIARARRSPRLETMCLMAGMDIRWT
jgi:pilus assembly protein CpaF